MPWNRLGSVVSALSADADLKAPHQQLQAAIQRSVLCMLCTKFNAALLLCCSANDTRTMDARGRRLAWAERETRFLDVWFSAVMQEVKWLEAAIQQAWRDLGRGAMTCGAGESGWWECLSVLRADESIWQQLCSKVWQHLSMNPAGRARMISAAGDDVQAQNLSSQMLARIIAPTREPK